MHERLSFFIPGNSLYHKANPLTKLTLVFSFILISYANRQPYLPACLLMIVICLA